MIDTEHLGAALDDSEKAFDAALIRTHAAYLRRLARGEGRSGAHRPHHDDRAAHGSVAYEVTESIAAIVANAQAARNFLNHRPPNPDEIRQALDCIVRDAYRSGAVIARIQGLFKETPLKKQRVEINGAIRDALELTRGEVEKSRVSVLTQFAEPSPIVQADRVLLQQVILNLIINAVEAMSSMREGSRELLICTEKAESNSALVAIRDSGPGLAPESIDRLFEPYATKVQAMGIGLSICRYIIAAHGGQIWAGANEPRGAVFQFTLPLR